MPEFFRNDRGFTPAIVAELENPVLDLEEDYLERLRFPAERNRLVLGLGGVPVEIRTDSDGIAEYLSDAFAPFLESGEPQVRLAVGEIAEDALPFQTLIGTMLTYARGSHAIGKFRQMAGYVDTGRREGRALVAGLNYRQDLGNYLRFVLAAMMPRLSAVLFHTAAVAHRNRAYIFFGPSTAGKSTLSRLSALHHDILTDDLLVLRLQDAQVRAATCGFWGGETRVYPTKRTDLPVAGFFRLRKAAENRIERLAPAAGALEVLCNIPSVKRSATDQRFLLGFAQGAVAAAPVYELGFHKRDDSFWSLLDELG